MFIDIILQLKRFSTGLTFRYLKYCWHNLQSPLHVLDNLVAVDNLYANLIANLYLIDRKQLSRRKLVIHLFAYTVLSQIFRRRYNKTNITILQFRGALYLNSTKRIRYIVNKLNYVVIYRLNTFFHTNIKVHQSLYFNRTSFESWSRMI